MKHIFLGLTLMSTMLIVGCNDESTVYVVEDFPPVIVEYDIIDSYGIDTGQDDITGLAISPEVDDGLFEIFWTTSHTDDHFIEFRINDTPSPNGSIHITTANCRNSAECSDIMLCQYFSELTVSCRVEEEIDISDLFTEIPQQLYFVLEACDDRSLECEYDYYPVLME